MFISKLKGLLNNIIIIIIIVGIIFILQLKNLVTLFNYFLLLKMMEIKY